MSDPVIRTLLAANVRRLRSERGWTMAVLASRVGARDRQTIAKICRAGVCSIEMLIRLADALGVTTDYLLGRTEQRDGGSNV